MCLRSHKDIFFYFLKRLEFLPWKFKELSPTDWRLYWIVVDTQEWHKLIRMIVCYARKN